MAKQFTQEQLQEYLEHPETIDAADGDLVEALAKASGLTADLGENEATDDPDAEDAKAAGVEAKAKADADAAKEAEAKAKADADAKAAQAAVDAAKGAKSEEGAVVLTPDGKHTIPFKALKDEREGRAAAESSLADANKTIISLAERIKALESGKKDPGPGDDEKTIDELRETLKQVAEEAPWLAPTLEKLVSRVEAVTDRLVEMDAEREESEDQQRARLQRQAGEAEASNPTLVLWKSQSPALFAEAAAFDQMLRQAPALRAQFPTFEKRFERAVELVMANHPGEDIPKPTPITSTTAAAKPGESAKPTAEEITARAEAELAKAGKSTVVTLSDIPGGAGEQGTQEALTRMSSAQIADKFIGMTPQQILDWVTSH